MYVLDISKGESGKDCDLQRQEGGKLRNSLLSLCSRVKSRDKEPQSLKTETTV